MNGHRVLEGAIMPMTAPVIVKHQETKNGDDDHEAGQNDSQQNARPTDTIRVVMHVVLQTET